MPVRTGRLGRKRSLLAATVTLVGGFEGLRTTAYLDPVGIPTACFGETLGVKMGQSFTRAECDAKLAARLVQFSTGVDRCLGSAAERQTDSQHKAFTSLSYNIGEGAFCKSSVVRRFKAGNTRASCDAILMWDKATKLGVRIRLPGLVKRRQEERKLCLEAA